MVFMRVDDEKCSVSLRMVKKDRSEVWEEFTLALRKGSQQGVTVGLPPGQWEITDHRMTREIALFFPYSFFNIISLFYFG